MATETSCDPLQESDITESSVVFFCMPGRQSVKDGIRINGKSMLIQEPSQELARGSEKVMTSGR